MDLNLTSLFILFVIDILVLALTTSALPVLKDKGNPILILVTLLLLLCSLLLPIYLIVKAEIEYEKAEKAYEKSLVHVVDKQTYFIRASADELMTDNSFRIHPKATDHQMVYTFLVKIPGKEGYALKTYEGKNVQHIPLKPNEKNPYIVVTRDFYKETTKSKKIKEKLKNNLFTIVPTRPRTSIHLKEIHYSSDSIPYKIQYDLK